MHKIFYITAVLFLAAVMGMVYAESIESDLQDGLLRLHVIANSDSDRDQQIKLAVRDEILSSVRAELRQSRSRSDVLDSVGDLEDIAKQKLDSMGVGYSARVSIENFYFPRKSYDGITLPAGRYESIRVVLGEGKGENWWCVAYPPLCFTENTFGELSPAGEKILREQLSPQSYDLISGENSQIQYKFKILEWFQKIREKITDK